MLTDVLTPEQRKKNMSAIRGKNTKPELKLRKLLHHAGFRFRLYQANLPGRPDLVLKKYSAVIFVNSCFWHCHDNCKYFKGYPRTHADFWRNKLGRNVARDKENYRELAGIGFRICIVWECALLRTGKLSDDEIKLRIEHWLKSDIPFMTLSGATSPSIAPNTELTTKIISTPHDE